MTIATARPILVCVSNAATAAAIDIDITTGATDSPCRSARNAAPVP